MSKNGWFSLDQMALKYPILLMDTCVLEGFKFFKDDPKNILEKEKDLDEKNDAIQIIKDYLNSGGASYITSSVFEEYIPDSNYSYKKSIKNLDTRLNDNQIDKELHSGLVSVHRKINRNKKSQRGLVELFEEQGRIIKLDKNEKQLYSIFDKKYSEFKEKYGISETDLNFLISGAILSHKRNPVALVSHDRGIFKAYNEFVNDQGLNSENFGFFIRSDNFKFERWHGTY